MYVQHIDDDAIASLTKYYGTAIEPGSRVLDLCSSWTSHLPNSLSLEECVGLGMNQPELDANEALTSSVQQDLNVDPKLPFADSSFDRVLNAVSIDYLVKPREVVGEVFRVTKPGGKAVFSFSNRCFPTKVIGRWLKTDDLEHCMIAASYLHYSGFTEVHALDIASHKPRTDPMFVVVGTKPGAAAL